MGLHCLSMPFGYATSVKKCYTLLVKTDMCMLTSGMVLLTGVNGKLFSMTRVNVFD